MSRSLSRKRWQLLSLTALIAAALVFSGCHRTGPQAAGPNQNNPQPGNGPAAAGGYPTQPQGGYGTGQPGYGPQGNGGPNGYPNQYPGQGGPGPGQGYAGGNGYQGQGGPQGAPGPQQGQPMAMVTLEPGTMAPVRIDSSVSTRSAFDGQPFTGLLYAPMVGSNGMVAFPPGTPVSGVVVATKNRGRFKGAGYLALRLQQIGGQRVHTTDFEISSKGKGRRTAGFIGGGAGGGALIGALAGGGEGALIGGLIGGGAGTAGAAFTDNKPLVIPAESRLRFQLTAPLTVAAAQ